jgi:hypothetical protein
LFGLIALCAAYDEGAIGDWGALHLRQDLKVGAGLAAAGYAAFALAEATGRLSGTALLERLGRTRVLVFGGRRRPDLDARLQRVPARAARDRLPGQPVRPAHRPHHPLLPSAGRRRDRLPQAKSMIVTSRLGGSGYPR